MLKVRPEGREQGLKYSDNDVGYQEPVEPIQRYGEYNQQQQVVTAVPSDRSQASAYESQQGLFYQPEVAVGNRYQTVLQKAATEKYAEIPNGGDLKFIFIESLFFLSYINTVK